MSTTFFGASKGVSGNVVMVGIPFDHGSTAHPGCANAPAILRLLSSGYHLSDEPLIDKATGNTLIKPTVVSDFGDITFSSSLCRESYFNDVKDISKKIIEAKKICFAVGGDHLVSLPLIQGVSKATKSFQVVQIDAHTDYAKQDSNRLPTHANFMSQVENIDNVEKIIQIGVRGIHHNQEPMPELFSLSTVQKLNEELIPGVPVYLTIDTDGFSPSQFSAVSFPEPGGITLHDLNTILTTLSAKKSKIIGVDWTEYNPSYDTKNTITGRYILQGILSILSYLGADIE